VPPGQPAEGRLTWRISQRWGIDSGHLDALKLALNRLVRLRENYPDQFKFKIMGTTESFLVCDSGQRNTPDQTYAIVGIEAMPTPECGVSQVRDQAAGGRPRSGGKTGPTV
jgi:hypothetical protein